MTRWRADLALGLAATLLSALYLRLAGGIADSLLSDGVGAAGIPRAVGWTLGLAGLLLCVRSIVRGARAPTETARAPQRVRPHLRAAGLLAILCGYVLLAPWLGYAAATGVLVAAGAWYAGAPRSRWLVLVPVAAAIVFWLLFVQAFGIPMPAGVLPGAR